MDLENGTNLTQQPKPVAVAFKRLWSLGMPSSTYPFLMRISKARTIGDLGEVDCCEILEVVESFLVRRAVCGIEPTGLHAVFKKLWDDCSILHAQSVREAISKYKTVAWPTDEEFADAIRSRPVYKSNITKFLISQYDKSLGGDVPENDFWVEHILPQKPDPEWHNHFSPAEREKYVDTLANLIPLSGSMNASLGNLPFKEKRKRYEADAMFKSARQLADDFSEWNFVNLKERADHLASWALLRWKFSALAGATPIDQII